MAFSRNWYKLDKVAVNGGFKKVFLLFFSKSPSEFFSSYFDIVSGNATLADDAIFVKANNRKYISKGIQDIALITIGNGCKYLLMIIECGLCVINYE